MSSLSKSAAFSIDSSATRRLALQATERAVWCFKGGGGVGESGDLFTAEHHGQLARRELIHLSV